MADSNTYIHYSAEDIQRYLNGAMTAREMHELERAALHDPFLADAIEGYRETSFSQTQQHLNEITAAIQVAKGIAKVVPVQPKRYHWWTAAAMAIITVGIGAVTWYFINNNKPAQEITALTVADDKTLPGDSLPKPPLNDSNVLIALTDGALKKDAGRLTNEPAPATGGVSATDKSRETLSNLIRTDDKTANQSTDTIAYEIITATEEDANAVAQTQTAPVQANKTGIIPLPGGPVIVNNNPVNNFSGVITDINKQPVPNAIVDAGKKNSTYTDAKGYFSIKARDSILPVTISSLGFVDTDVQLRNKELNAISLQPDEMTLSEVVVTGYGKRKELEKKSNDAAGPYPAGGWASFQEYVYKQLNRPVDTNNNQITGIGNVELEFAIEDDGTPVDFRVLKSVDTATDKKAIEIVKEGPRWITDKKRKKKGKVSIRF